MKRRHLNLVLPIVVLAAIRPRVANSQSAELKESDPEAIAVEYKTDATKVDRAKSQKYKAGQICSNCGLFFPQAGSAVGGCQLFLGKDVAALGWCNAWEAKAK